MTDAALITWMLETDPALRWQVERDLLQLPEEVWQATRARVATEGMGSRMLAHQDPDGQWAGGAYFPADASDDEPGQPWTATTWSLNALREWGLDAAVLGDTAERLDANAVWEYESLPYWGGETDVCINAFTLANGAWLGADVAALADWFPAHQLADGGWNCEWVEGSTRSSVHSTLNALRGLLWYEREVGGSAALREARAAGEEYLLARRVLFRLGTDDLIDPRSTRFAYPLRWRSDALRATDYFREAAAFDGGRPDPRLAEAIEVVRAARQPDGTWVQGEIDAGRVWFDLDVPAGEPSPWLTLYGTRVLDWWDASR